MNVSKNDRFEPNGSSELIQMEVKFDDVHKNIAT